MSDQRAPQRVTSAGRTPPVSVTGPPALDAESGPQRVHSAGRTPHAAAMTGPPSFESDTSAGPRRVSSAGRTPHAAAMTGPPTFMSPPRAPRLGEHAPLLAPAVEAETEFPTDDAPPRIVSRGQSRPQRDDVPLTWGKKKASTGSSEDVLMLSEGGGFVIPAAATKRRGPHAFPLHRTNAHQVSIGAEHSAATSDVGLGLDLQLQEPYTTVSLYSTMIVAAMVGALIRMECNVFAKHDMYTVYPRLYANMLGCLIMGPLIKFKAWFVCQCYPLYIALGVGLCGSITSFSSWQTESTMAFVNWPGYVIERYNNPEGKIIGSLTVQMVGIATSTAALSFGMMVAEIFSAKDFEFDAPKPPLRALSLLDVKVVFACAVVAAVFIGANFGDGERDDIGWTMIFAPFGVLLRYGLSRRYNTGGWFPWGTLTANLLGTLVTAVCIIHNTRHAGTMSAAELATVTGIINGFCGCLSTVSTWVFELRTLSTVPTRAIGYAAASVLSAQLLLVLIVGVYRWTHDVSVESPDN